MDWIVMFMSNWETYFPLYVSMNLSEKAYLEPSPSVRHMLRVMSIEALLSSETVYGKRIMPRILKLLGGKDLYAQYESDIQCLPTLICDETLLDQIFTARKKIGHGDRMPREWVKKHGRQGSERSLCYADMLTEAATSIVSLLWQHILNERLQETFADKAKLEAYLQTL